MSQHEHPPQHAALPLIGAIAGVIRWVEELISLLSGPLLSVGLAVALIDLLTGGSLLRSVPELLYVWGVCQAVGIDAQLVATWDRCRTAIRRHNWAAVAGLVVLGCALGYVGFLSAETFGLQQAFGLSEGDALARLGIDSASWQLQRAVLAVFLVALSGFTRYHPSVKAKPSAEAERADLERELELEPLRQRLRAQKAVGVAALARSALSAAAGREPASVPVVSTESKSEHSDKPPTGPGSPAAVPTEPPVRTPPGRRRAAVLTLPDPDARPRRRAAASGHARARSKPRVRTPASTTSVEQQARAAWQLGMTVSQLQVAAGISRNAASTWRRILAAENQGAAPTPATTVPPEAVGNDRQVAL
jgi:hypothetical protein